jgi:hypothetical protein
MNRARSQPDAALLRRGRGDFSLVEKSPLGFAAALGILPPQQFRRPGAATPRPAVTARLLA